MGAGADALKTAIDHAWRVFDLPAPKTTGVCINCCMNKDIEADFLRKRPRDLPVDYVRDWYFAAYHDSISHDHIAWFLPRVMDMLAMGEDVAMVGREVAFARLPLTGYPDQWRADEVAAINRFALAFFAETLASDKPDFACSLDNYLCMFGQGGIDVGPLLKFLDAMPDDDLAALLHRNWFFWGNGQLPNNAFWSAEPGQTLVWNWYRSPQMLTRMEQAAMTGNEQALAVHSLIATYGATPPP